MPGPTLRPPVPGDARRLLAIRYLEPQPEPLAIGGSLGMARRLGRLLEGTSLDLAPARTTVVEADGRVVALMELWRRGEGIELRPLPFARLLARGFALGGPGLLWRVAKHQRLFARVDAPRPPDALYISHLDTHPAHRRRGYASLLMDEAERVARTEGFASIALDVYLTNPARRLYEQYGYVTIDERTDAAFERFAGIPGYATMVKRLEPA